MKKLMLIAAAALACGAAFAEEVSVVPTLQTLRVSPAAFSRTLTLAEQGNKKAQAELARMMVVTGWNEASLEERERVIGTLRDQIRLERANVQRYEPDRAASPSVRM